MRKELRKKISYKRWSLNVFLSVIFLIMITIPVNAAKYITVATIGNKVPAMDKTQGMQSVVDQVIHFWKKKLEQVLPDKPDLILLTEACDRPSGMSKKELTDYYLTRKNQIKEYFASVSKENHCYIVFGTKRLGEDGNWYNTSYVLDREGRVSGLYNKNFPTIGEMESGIKASDEVPIIQCDFGRVACVICFDLNFPELLIKYQKAKPDIILFSSMYHGGLVQNYWAYSCRSFFVSSIGDRVAPSEIRNPLGEVIARTTNYFDFTIARLNLDRCQAHLDGNWEKLSALKSKYGRTVSISDPGQLGSVLIASENPDISVSQMIREFNITLLDNFLEKSRAFRLEPGNMEQQKSANVNLMN